MFGNGSKKAMGTLALDKARRMITGGVVFVTTAFVVLLSILVFNIVTVCVQNNRLAQLAAEGAYLEQLTQNTNDSIAVLQQEEGKFHLAWEHGFRPIK